MMLTLKVHPNSKEVLLKEKDGVMHAYLTEPAGNNRANRQLLKVLAKKYGSCRLVRGVSSRTKTVEVPDA